VPVREGLVRLEGVESISERCNRQAGTGELRLKNARLVDPQTLAKQIADIRVGARLRGLEATIDGFLEKKDGKPVFRISKSNEILLLSALTTKVQIDAIKTKKPEPPTQEEKQGYKRLRARVKDQPQPVRITGPLRSGMMLEVRTFEFKS
jgi:hypothetical protein